MRKFISPVIVIVNLILCGIAFGLAANTAAYTPAGTERTAIGNYYQLVWNQPNLIGVLSFFLFVVGVFFVLLSFIPTKAFKCVAVLAGGMLIGSGVLALGFLAKSVAPEVLGYTNSGSLIAFSVLLFVAGGLSVAMGLFGLVSKKED